MGEERRRYGSAREWVYHELRSRIISGEIAGGQQLRSKPLTEQFGVSVSPLREAIHQLAANGFVDLSPQRGARVTVVSRDDLVALYEARQLLEPEAARMSASATDEAHAKAIAVALAQVPRVEPTDAQSRAASATAEEAVLAAVERRCPNRWLIAALDALRGHTVRARAVLAVPVGCDDVRGRMDEIRDAVVASSPDDVRRLVAALLTARRCSAEEAIADR